MSDPVCFLLLLHHILPPHMLLSLNQWLSRHIVHSNLFSSSVFALFPLFSFDHASNVSSRTFIWRTDQLLAWFPGVVTASSFCIRSIIICVASRLLYIKKLFPWNPHTLVTRRSSDGLYETNVELFVGTVVHHVLPTYARDGDALCRSTGRYTCPLPENDVVHLALPHLPLTGDHASPATWLRNVSLSAARPAFATFPFLYRQSSVFPPHFVACAMIAFCMRIKTCWRWRQPVPSGAQLDIFVGSPSWTTMQVCLPHSSRLIKQVLRFKSHARPLLFTHSHYRLLQISYWWA